MQALLLFLGLLIMIVVVIFLTGVYVRYLTYDAVKKLEKMMVCTEQILDTGTVPEHWRNVTSHNSTTMTSDEKINKMKTGFKRRAIINLKKLIKHHKHSILPENKETRKLLIDKLTVVLKKWEASRWEEMCD